jgi:hypothetical protein
MHANRHKLWPALDRLKLSLKESRANVLLRITGGGMKILVCAKITVDR